MNSAEDSPDLRVKRFKTMRVASLLTGDELKAALGSLPLETLGHLIRSAARHEEDLQTMSLLHAAVNSRKKEQQEFCGSIGASSNAVQLPKPVWCHIATFLALHEAGRMQRCSRFWWSLINETSSCWETLHLRGEFVPILLKTPGLLSRVRRARVDIGVYAALSLPGVTDLTLVGHDAPGRLPACVHLSSLPTQLLHLQLEGETLLPLNGLPRGLNSLLSITLSDVSRLDTAAIALLATCRGLESISLDSKNMACLDFSPLSACSSLHTLRVSGKHPFEEFVGVQLPAVPSLATLAINLTTNALTLDRKTETPAGLEQLTGLKHLMLRASPILAIPDFAACCEGVDKTLPAGSQPIRLETLDLRDVSSLDAVPRLPNTLRELTVHFVAGPAGETQTQREYRLFMLELAGAPPADAAAPREAAPAAAGDKDGVAELLRNRMPHLERLELRLSRADSSVFNVIERQCPALKLLRLRGCSLVMDCCKPDSLFSKEPRTIYLRASRAQQTPDDPAMIVLRAKHAPRPGGLIPASQNQDLHGPVSVLSVAACRLLDRGCIIEGDAREQQKPPQPFFGGGGLLSRDLARRGQRLPFVMH